MPPEPYTSVPPEVAAEETAAERELASFREDGVSSSGQSVTSPTGQKAALDITLEEIRRYLRLLVAKTSYPDAGRISHQDLVAAEWQRLIRVLDRLFFVVFLIITVIVTIGFYAHN